MTRRPPRSTLFPSPTLSRSSAEPGARWADVPESLDKARKLKPLEKAFADHLYNNALSSGFSLRALSSDSGTRSEEHTSELQSQSNLGCRLLPEKKKKTTYKY